MSLVALLGLLLFPCLVINWATFVLFVAIARAHRGIRAIIDRRWLSLGIAILNTAFALLALSYFWRLSLGPEINALLLASPVYVLTAVNVIALVLTWRRGW